MGIRFRSKRRKRKIIKIIIFLIIIYILINIIKVLDISQVPSINKYIFNLSTNKIDIKIKPKNILYFGLNTKIKNLNSPNTLDLISDKETVINPIVYIYNTHQSEEYDKTFNDAYDIAYTTWTASYILSDYLKELNINSLVENSSIKEYLNNNNLTYSKSYEASRFYINNRLNEYSSIKYLIDLHRDSLNKDRTTVLIDGKNYAKIKFVIGLDNKDYNDNLNLAYRLSSDLGLISGGIIKKQGKKVNGVYNQDLSQNAVLIEVGGIDNNIEEVALSLKVFAEALSKEINNER